MEKSTIGSKDGLEKLIDETRKSSVKIGCGCRVISCLHVLSLDVFHPGADMQGENFTLEDGVFFDPENLRKW